MMLHLIPPPRAEEGMNTGQDLYDYGHVYDHIHRFQINNHGLGLFRCVFKVLGRVGRASISGGHTRAACFAGFNGARF